MDEKIVSVKIEKLGVLNGRDCIYIDTVTQDDMDNLIFKGEINGWLAEKIKTDKFIPYKLTFKRIIAYFSCELDTYENIDNFAHLDYSCFNIVENSKWLENFPVRMDFDKSIYKHYQIFTYDFVYNIIAVDFDFSVSGLWNIRKAQLEDLQVITDVVHRTTNEIYPKYYPQGAVEFFLNYHNENSIRQDITDNNVYLLEDDNKFIGTVTVNDNEINRLYVLPKYQGKGYGGFLLEYAEKIVLKSHDEIILSSSFPAKAMYLKRGYKEYKYEIFDTKNGDFLCCDIMKKNI
ncbi:MAG: GNAT family N-acetyltransferase [Alistipes senegalensis]|nr:GNAT family N-acetyltransferase [Alistipes senegalensis]